jgi:hypothetical protein
VMFLEEAGLREKIKQHAAGLKSSFRVALQLNRIQ